MADNPFLRFLEKPSDNPFARFVDGKKRSLPAGIERAREISEKWRKEVAPNAPAVDPAQAQDYQTGFARNFAQGATLGAGDEAISAASTIGGSEPYDVNLANERGSAAEFAKQYPWTAAGAKVGGAIVGTTPIFRAVPAMVSGLGRIGAAGAVGAGIGGAEGFLSGEGGFENRARDAGRGAAIGGAAGLGLQSLAEGANKVWQIGRNYFRATPTDERAANALNQALTRDKTDIPAISAKLQADKGADVVDVAGENTVRLARNVASQPGDAANIQRDFVINRGERSFKNVNDAILKTFNPEDFTTKLASSRARLKAQADAAYAEVERLTPLVRTKEIDNILETPEAQSSLRDVLRRVEPGAPSALGPVNPQSGAVENYYIAALRKVKSDLFARGDALENALTGRNTEAGAYLKRLSHRLNDELKKASEPFKKAAAEYADEAAQITALQKGANEFLKMRPEEIRNFLAGKSQAEREMFLNGAYDALERGPLSVGANRNIAASLLNRPGVTERIKAVLTPNEWMALRERLKTESDRFATTQIVGARSGSQTAPRLMDDSAISGDTAADLLRAGSSAVQGNFGTTVDRLLASAMRAGGRQINKARGIDEESAAILANYLLRPSTSQEYQRATMSLLQALPKAQAGKPRRIISPQGLLGLSRP